MYLWAAPKLGGVDPEASADARRQFDQVLFAPWEDGGTPGDPTRVDQATIDEEERLFNQAAGL